MFGKIINNKLEIFSETLEFENGKCICNPSDEMLIKNGFKIIVRDNDPIIEPTQYTEEYYDEDNNTIFVHFKIIDTIQ